MNRDHAGMEDAQTYLDACVCMWLGNVGGDVIYGGVNAKFLQQKTRALVAPPHHQDSWLLGNASIAHAMLRVSMSACSAFTFSLDVKPCIAATRPDTLEPYAVADTHPWGRLGTLSVCRSMQASMELTPHPAIVVHRQRGALTGLYRQRVRRIGRIAVQKNRLCIWSVHGVLLMDGNGVWVQRLINRGISVEVQLFAHDFECSRLLHAAFSEDGLHAVLVTHESAHFAVYLVHVNLERKKLSVVARKELEPPYSAVVRTQFSSHGKYVFVMMHLYDGKSCLLLLDHELQELARRLLHTLPALPPFPDTFRFAVYDRWFVPRGSRCAAELYLFCKALIDAPMHATAPKKRRTKKTAFHCLLACMQELPLDMRVFVCLHAYRAHVPFTRVTLQQAHAVLRAFNNR